MMNESGRTLRDVSNRAFLITTKKLSKNENREIQLSIGSHFHSLLMFAGCTNNKTQTQEPAQE